MFPFKSSWLVYFANDVSDVCKQIITASSQSVFQCQHEIAYRISSKLNTNVNKRKVSYSTEHSLTNLLISINVKPPPPQQTPITALKTSNTINSLTI